MSAAPRENTVRILQYVPIVNLEHTVLRGLDHVRSVEKVLISHQRVSLPVRFAPEDFTATMTDLSHALHVLTELIQSTLRLGTKSVILAPQEHSTVLLRAQQQLALIAQLANIVSEERLNVLRVHKVLKALQRR